MSKKDILIKEDLEIAITTGMAPIVLPGRVVSIFPALAHRNFQLYIFGQTISLVGFWLHQVAMGWLVFQMTHSAFWVGAIGAIGGLPFLIFTVFAGVYIDKADKQKLLLLTQSLEAIFAFVLGLVIFLNLANLTLIAVLVFLNGIVAAVDLPARQTFIIEMVGKRDLASAIPINNALFNGARFVGPALAGFLIVTTGLGWPFILNGVSFLAAIWAIANVKPVYSYKAEVDIGPFDSLKRGLTFTFTHPKIFNFIILAFFTAVFIWPFQTLMPVVAEEVFASGARGLGSLLSAAGAGSLLGAIFTSSQARRKEKGSLVLAGVVISSMSFLLFSINHNFILAHLMLFTAGFGTLLQVSTLNTLVQLSSPDQMRARIMAVYLTMFVGMMPIGNMLAGVIAQHTSALFAIGLGAAITLIVAIYLYFRGVFTDLSR